MVLQSTGRLSFANITTEFGGTKPRKMSEYYASAGKYTSGVSGIPSAGTPIKFSQFYGKAKPTPTTAFESMSSTAQTATVAIYGMKLLRNAYSGPIINIRRSTDNATKDFYASFAFWQTGYARVLPYCDRISI